MKLVITMNLDNAAFADGNEQAEIARIIREYADRITSGLHEKSDATLYDINGNLVGTARILNQS
jgi:hypothetical protein